MSAFIFCAVPGCASQNAASQPRAISKINIVLAAETIPSEETAAKELQHYLSLITGETCPIIPESQAAGLSGTVIYVGSTQLAKTNITGKSTFRDEEWLMQTHGNSLILIGGRPRGTLYAAYHFLEDVCGVCWWNPFEETVPKQKVLTIPTLNKRSQPAFEYRDIFRSYTDDGGRFMARSRLDRQGSTVVDAAYGGTRSYGPPEENHTTFLYLPPAKYFKDHPDWYIVPSGGTPTPRTAQLCFSNPEMRKEFLKVLLENIRTSRQKAIDAQLPPPDMFAVSQEDNRVSFVCADNKALVEKEGSESAVLLDFVNYLADGVKTEFPTVYIDTLAYLSGEKAPKTMSARDNVIVRLTDTQSNVLLPVTAERNQVLRKNVEEWSQKCKNLRIWDYDITYIYPQLPTPNMQTFPTDLRFFLQHGVNGMFIEFEEPIKADMRDLKVWVLCKLLEDPKQNYDALVQKFTDGFYGAAAPNVRQYLTLLQTSAKQSKADVDWFANLLSFNYLNIDFLEKANHIYDDAAAKVANDPVLSSRVRNARASVDFAILRRFHRLMQGWVDAGHSQESFPLNRQEVAKRYLQNWNEQIDLRSPENVRAAQHQEAESTMQGFVAGPTYIPVPTKFKDIPRDKLFVYSALDTRNYHEIPKVVPDKDSQSGVATRMEIPASDLPRYKLPMLWGVYDDLATKNTMTGEPLKAAEVPSAGYHWYKMGETTLTAHSYIYLTWSWWIQNDIGDAFSAADPTAKYDVWVHLKFEGPAFPHGNAQDKNAISVDYMVLVRK